MIDPIVAGPRIYLRHTRLDDIDKGWLEWINDTELTRYLMTKPPISREKLVEFFLSSQPPQTYMMAVCDKETDEYIGNARISKVDYVNQHATYGRLIGNRAYYGKGIGKEVIMLILKFGFSVLGLHRMYAGALASNQASIHSNLKSGLRHEGTQRGAVRKGNEHLDILWFSVLKHEFKHFIQKQNPIMLEVFE